MTGRRLAALVLFDLAAILVCAGLVSLGAWQLHRRDWKLDLIARVEERARALPVAAPGPERWTAISAAADEYRRVTVTGEWLPDRPALVQAVTELGGGYWVLTPLRRDDGTTVLVNRGFVPTERRDPSFWRSPSREVTIIGLLRISETGGALLRSNDATSDRWFSRDVAAIAASRGLSSVAPYFVDAERAPGETDLPVGSLTVLRFSNNHLLYALTWAGLALMAAAAAVAVNVDLLRRGRARASLRTE